MTTTAAAVTPTTRVLRTVLHRLTGPNAPAERYVSAAPGPNLAHTNDLASAAIRSHFRS